MPKAFPEKLRADVVKLPRKRKVPLSQIARDFGISKPCRPCGPQLVVKQLNSRGSGRCFEVSTLWTEKRFPINFNGFARDGRPVALGSPG